VWVLQKARVGGWGEVVKITSISKRKAIRSLPREKKKKPRGTKKEKEKKQYHGTKKLEKRMDHSRGKQENMETKTNLKSSGNI